MSEQLVVELAAVGELIRLHLLEIDAAEIGRGDVAPFDARHNVSWRGTWRTGEEIGDVEADKCQNDDPEAPFEPVLVLPHPVEHCHGLVTPRRKTGKRSQL